MIHNNQCTYHHKYNLTSNQHCQQIETLEKENLFFFIPILVQSVAKECSSSFWGEMMKREFKMNRVAKTNLSNGTTFSNIIFEIILQKI